MRRPILGSIVASPDFRPLLRSDLEFLAGSSDDVVVIHDLRTDSRVEIYAIECQIARAMNGSRNLAALAKIAESSFGSVATEQVAKVVAQIAGMGLIENIHELRLEAAPPAAERQNPKPSASSPDEDHLGIGDQTAVRAIGAIDSHLPTSSWSEAEQSSEDTLEQASNTGDAMDDHLDDNDFDQGEGESSADFDDDNQEEEEEQGERAWEPPVRDNRKLIRKFIKIGIGLALLLLFAFWPWPLYVTEPCEIRPLVRSEVRAEIPGIVAETLVREGDIVEQGQLLARLDDRDVKHQLARAKAEADGLRANLEKLKAGSRPEEIRQAKAHVTASKADHAIARRRFERVKALFEKDVGSRSDLDEAKGLLAVRAQEVAEAKAAMNLVEAGFRSEEIQMGKAELHRAEADITFLEKQLELLEIRAPLSGQVLTPRFDERLHEKIEAGETLVEIGDATTMRVEIAVPEKFADVLELGQAVEVKVHSYPLRSFHGKIAFISPAVEIKDGTRILRVDANVDNSEGLLQVRMTGWGEINAGSSTPLFRVFRSAARWIRVRYLL